MIKCTDYYLNGIRSISIISIIIILYNVKNII